MRIALIGTRGVPASHGGFETCVEEIGKRLVQKGHGVTVYSKKPLSGKKYDKYEGMKVVNVPRVPVRGFETLLAAFLSVVHSLFHDYDMHMLFDPANGPCLILYKMTGKAYAINVDGLGSRRGKWGYWAKKYYKWSEWVTAKLCRNIVTDSNAMAKYYGREYGVETTTIAYGANMPESFNSKEREEALCGFGLTSNGYFLQVTRFEPENSPLVSLQAFNSLPAKMRMVLVGGLTYKTGYAKAIYQEASKNPAIILPGFIYDKKVIGALWANAFCYIHGNHIGGTNPALLQAMAAGRPVIARDCEFNREVLEDRGYYYEKDAGSLREKMSYVIAYREEAEAKAAMALKRVKEVYDWNRITAAYERLFQTITGASAMK